MIGTVFDDEEWRPVTEADHAEAHLTILLSRALQAAEEGRLTDDEAESLIGALERFIGTRMFSDPSR